MTKKKIRKIIKDEIRSLLSEEINRQFDGLVARILIEIAERDGVEFDENFIMNNVRKYISCRLNSELLTQQVVERINKVQIINRGME